MLNFEFPFLICVESVMRIGNTHLENIRELAGSAVECVTLLRLPFTEDYMYICAKFCWGHRAASCPRLGQLVAFAIAVTIPYSGTAASTH